MTRSRTPSACELADGISEEAGANAVAAALMGTTGLIWSVIGHSKKSAPLVLALLVIGIVSVLAGGVPGAFFGLENDLRNDNLGSPVDVALRLFVVSWLVVAPAIVGFFQARRAIEMLRSPA